MKIHINDFTILVDRPPQIVLLAVYLYEDFIDVERVAIASVFTFESSSVYSTEFDTPEAERFSGYGDAPFGEDMFNITMRNTITCQYLSYS